MRYLVVPLQLHFRYEKRFPRDIGDMQGNKYGRLKEYTMAQSLNNVYFKSVCTVNVSERMKSLSLLVLQTIFKILSFALGIRLQAFTVFSMAFEKAIMTEHE